MTPHLIPLLVTLMSVCFITHGNVLYAAAPAAPSDLSASVQNVSGTVRYYVFFWQDNSTDENGFRLESRVGGGAFAPVNGAVTGSNADVLDGNIDGWTIGTTVEFRIAAFNADGSSYSNIVAVTMTADSFTAPTNVTATPTSDSQILLQWADASNLEDGVEIEMRETGVQEFYKLADWNFYWTPFVNITELTASTGYEFRLRAYRQTSATTRQYTGYSSTVSATTSSFSGVPTNLAVTATNEETLQFSWADPFSSESGFEIQYGLKSGSGPTSFEILGTTNSNETSTTPISGWLPGTTYDFRIRAVSIANGVPVYSGFSDVVTFSVPFHKPTSFSVVSTTHSTATLTWQDNSLVEAGYEILVRAAGETAFLQWSSTSANQTSVTITDLPEGLPLEFAVRAFFEFTVESEVYYTFSEQSNIASASTKDWFYTRLHQGGLTGQSFAYSLMTTEISPRVSWSVTNLPEGLTFNPASGVISGALQSRGVFVCPVTATFANGWVAQDNLTIRVAASPATPIVLEEPVTEQRAKVGQQLGIPLADAFLDADTESAVKVATNLGSFNMALYDSAAPQTVANFLAYVNDPDEAENFSSSLIYRSDPGFVIQGGGFKQVSSSQFTTIPSKPSPLNEPGIPNMRGTVSMAKIDGLPNSASSDFFVNLANNASNLDNQNGGFTVFGRMAGGMLVPDLIALLPRSTLNATIDGQSASLSNFPRTAEVPPGNVVIHSISQIPALSFAVTANSHPAVVEAFISEGTLQLSGLSPGASLITYTVTDVDGNVLTRQLNVTVEQTLAQWLSASSLPAGDQGITADADSDGLSNLEEFAFFGNLTGSDAEGVRPEIVLVDDNGITRQGIKFRLRKFAADLKYVVQASEDLSITSWDDIWSWSTSSGAPTASGINDPLILEEYPDHYEVVIMDHSDIGSTDRGFLRVKLVVEQPSPPQPD